MAGQIALIPVVVLGLILAFMEMVFVHKDEAGLGWLAHSLHSIPTMFILLFISMNIDYVIGFTSWTPTFWMVIAIRVVVGLIAMAKIRATVAVSGRVGEKWPHTALIAVLIVLAPYMWEYIACNFAFVKTLPFSGCPVSTTP